MKLTILLLLLPVNSLADTFLERSDHQLHILTSYSISTTLTQIMRSKGVSRWNSILYSSLATMAIGFAKEGLDSQFAWDDIASDAIGTSLNVGITFSFDL